MIGTEELQALGIILLVLILIFLLFREVVCWYLKINQRMRLMEEQNEALKAIFEQLGGTISDEREIERKARLYDKNQK